MGSRRRARCSSRWRWSSTATAWGGGASRFAASPAARHDLRPPLRVRAVDGEPTPDLDAFLAAVAGREDRSALRLRTEDLEGRTRMQTLQLDLRYWPTVEWVFREDAEGGAWIRRGPDS